MEAINYTACGEKLVPEIKELEKKFSKDLFDLEATFSKNMHALLILGAIENDECVNGYIKIGGHVHFRRNKEFTHVDTADVINAAKKLKKNSTDDVHDEEIFASLNCRGLKTVLKNSDVDADLKIAKRMHALLEENKELKGKLKEQKGKVKEQHLKISMDMTVL